MTGEMPFPEGLAGAGNTLFILSSSIKNTIQYIIKINFIFKCSQVYFSYSTGAEQRWIFLGKLCNEKPSSIFKIGNLKHDHNTLTETPFGFMQQVNSHTTAMIGISVEPVQNIDALVPATSTATNGVDSYLNFAQKMLEHFYNYSASFAKDGGDGQQYVSLMTLQNWFESFKRRLEINPNFWRN
jgi:hypothetical protein